jgi:ferritin
VNHEWKNFNLLATWLKAKIAAEKRHHMILEAINYLTRVGPSINFEGICDSIPIKCIVQFASINS